ncbi:hypothetical protein FGO68_gene15564 [Halteria grandinella]|uniref:Uncharacterized protein n=1 Tax=Halteria grandinella TaxID=5974 RepID=A0A8J8T5W9_HALGN|nr:hypothetical protein FGO68_gene15564 [Halteria grandinella]
MGNLYKIKMSQDNIKLSSFTFPSSLRARIYNYFHPNVIFKVIRRLSVSEGGLIIKSNLNRNVTIYFPKQRQIDYQPLSHLGGVLKYADSLNIHLFQSYSMLLSILNVHQRIPIITKYIDPIIKSIPSKFADGKISVRANSFSLESLFDLVKPRKDGTKFVLKSVVSDHIDIPEANGNDFLGLICSSKNVEMTKVNFKKVDSLLPLPEISHIESLKLRDVDYLPFDLRVLLEQPSLKTLSFQPSMLKKHLQKPLKTSLETIKFNCKSSNNCFHYPFTFQLKSISKKFTQRSNPHLSHITFSCKRMPDFPDIEKLVSYYKKSLKSFTLKVSDYFNPIKLKEISQFKALLKYPVSIKLIVDGIQLIDKEQRGELVNELGRGLVREMSKDMKVMWNKRLQQIKVSFRGEEQEKGRFLLIVDCLQPGRIRLV